jgi:hypothetical protein
MVFPDLEIVLYPKVDTRIDLSNNDVGLSRIPFVDLAIPLAVFEHAKSSLGPILFTLSREQCEPFPW